jgi:uncharacterized membrane protein YccC
MNLVAKEYVASQPADDPEVLVLSCFAGAALMGAFAAEADLEQARVQAGLMNSNLQAVFQRTMRELDREPARFHGYLLAVTMLQRLLLSLNTLRIIGVRPELTLPGGKRFAGDLARELERLGDALERETRPASLQELGEALHALRGAMARTPGGASLRSIVIARVGQQVLTLHAAVAQLFGERGSELGDGTEDDAGDGRTPTRAAGPQPWW